MTKHNSRRNDSGFTLLELIAVLTISSVIFIVAAVVLTMWGLRFEQLSKIAKLQDQAFDCIQTIKHGRSIEEDSGLRNQFIGLTNANSMSFIGNSVTYYTENDEYVNGYSGISFKPPKNHSTLSNNDFVNIYLKQGYVVYDAEVFGVSEIQSSNIKLFPDDISNNKDIYVQSLVFAPVSSLSNPDNLEIVRVILKARAKFPEINEDQYGAYRDPYSVEYETFIAIEKRKE